jgi:hypothetical protein
MKQFKILILAMLLAASVCHAEPEETGPWEISVGADSVISFQPEYVPTADYCYGFTVTGRPDEAFVSPVLPGKESLAEHWQPEGKPPGIYVFVLDLKTGQVELMAWERFLELDRIEEDASRKWSSDYKDLACQGKTERDVWVFPIQINGKELVAATSFDSKKKVKSTFGIPSIIPFMGRQKWIEKKTTFSVTLFLEVFDRENPSTPLVQFKKRFHNHAHHATVSNLAAWVQGAEPPLLVVMESTDRSTNQNGRIFLARPLPAAS